MNESISNVFFLSGWFNRCYFVCSVACFREIYSFTRHWGGVPVLWATTNCNNKCRCCGEVNLFWFCRVAVEICLWGLYWWSSCNDGIMFRHSKKVHKRAPKAKGALCHSQICIWSQNSPTLLKNVLDSTSKLAITSNLEASTPACLNNSAKACFRHTKFFYSTHLYYGCWKGTF